MCYTNLVVPITNLVAGLKNQALNEPRALCAIKAEAERRSPGKKLNSSPSMKPFLLSFSGKDAVSRSERRRIAAFERSFSLLARNERLTRESIHPVEELPSYEQISPGKKRSQSARQGCDAQGQRRTGHWHGTGKGEIALPVRDGNTFLDLIVRQVLAARKETGANLRFC